MLGKKLVRRIFAVFGVIFGAVLFIVVAGELFGVFDALTEWVPWPVWAAVMLAGGYPVLLKATAGGGGRGIRVCHDKDELTKNFDLAYSEAEKAFGDGHLILEKFIYNAHHIEFQVLGDKRGSVIHLGERDCSIQRRNQKLIEIASGTRPVPRGTPPRSRSRAPRPTRRGRSSP